MNPFSVTISTFESFDSQPIDTTLAKWIEDCRNGCESSDQVTEYRQTRNPDLKKSLPLATVGAVCQGGRKMENVVSRTGWIALDIDQQDNPHIKGAEALRDELKKIVFVAMAGLSVSGAGVWCLVRVSDPDKQADHFEQLQTDFASVGIVLDSTKGRNPHDARFYSYDPDMWHREDFKLYDRLPKPKPVRAIKRVSTGKDTRSSVEALVSEIQQRKVDITQGYGQWLRIGFSLADEFGESGRDMFHAISQFHPDYSEREADRQYTSCIRSNGEGITIATFFHTCREHSIIAKGNHSSIRDHEADGESGRYWDNKFKLWINEKGYPEMWDKLDTESV